MYVNICLFSGVQYCCMPDGHTISPICPCVCRTQRAYQSTKVTGRGNTHLMTLSFADSPLAPECLKIVSRSSRATTAEC